MALEDDRKHDQPADVPSLASGDNRPQDEPIFEEIDDDTDAIIIAPARQPTSARGGSESRVLSREEWLKEIGPFWEDATDEAVARGLAFIILGGKSGPTPPETSRGPRTSGRSRATGESPTENDIFDDVTDTVGGIIISGVRPGASFEKPNPER